MSSEIKGLKDETVKELQEHTPVGWIVERGTVIGEKPYIWIHKGTTYRLMRWPEEVELNV